jgi:hypothetical protein
MTTQSKLSTALRQKFPGPLGPRAALRALGLDADVLEVPGSNKGDDARTMRVAIDAQGRCGHLERRRRRRAQKRHRARERQNIDRRCAPANDENLAVEARGRRITEPHAFGRGRRRGREVSGGRLKT